MQNIRILIEYDGTDFVGWQRQPNGTSVQGTIERTLKDILREDVSVIGAGRTDAGVHAHGQVANFRTASAMTPLELHGALKGLLPPAIVVRETASVPLGFHARYDAREREYVYRISVARTALRRLFTWFVKYELDRGLMQRAAGVLLGEHDFQSFCRANVDANHHRCVVTCSEWREEEGELRYTVRANRFLHGMVRGLVGTMVDLGRGYITLDDFNRLFDVHDRAEAGMSAPAQGLCLEKVYY